MNKNKRQKLAVFAAGGTGGHINSALALGEKFSQNDYQILFFSGNRPIDKKLFAGQNVIHLESQPLKGSNILKLISSLLKNLMTFFQVLSTLLQKRPNFALGAGGYVCGPTLLAAYILGIPVYILEQNSVMGLTNKVLLYFSKKTFVNFRKTLGIPVMFKDKSVFSGNPIRSNFSKFSPMTNLDTRFREKSSLNVLVFGGSLGAESINKMVWDFIRHPSPISLHIKHQIGGAHIKDAKVENGDWGKNIFYEPKEYFLNIEDEYLWCDVIFCRSGASTVAELRVVKKPVVLIPYPFHADKHQFINGYMLKEEVSFPVSIETCEELQENNFIKLRGHLQKVQEQLRNVKKNSAEVKVNPPPLEATNIIFNEIQKNV